MLEQTRILNPYRGCNISEILALFDWAGTSPSLPGALSCAGGRERLESGHTAGFNRQFFAYFHAFSLYFHLKNVGKSHRKAIINYLREKYANLKKDLTFRQASAGSGTSGRHGKPVSTKMSGPGYSPRLDRVFFAFI